MLFKKPNVFDKPIKLFDVDDVALHIVISKTINNVVVHTRDDSEKLLIPLRGCAKFGNMHAYSKDIIYIPRGFEDISIDLELGSIVYIVEAPSNTVYKPYIKRFENAKTIHVGDEHSRRTRYVMIDVDDSSEKFLAGYTFCCPGCWGSYPPHRHDDKYEIFIYFDVEPGFGVQLLIDDDKEEAYVVKDFDVFLVTRGYHPNVSAPIKGLKYLWIMVAVKGSRNFSMSVNKAFVETQTMKM
ncbi:5-deoxy-glucuronate isomerase [Ignisphaera sp. 4213-co]|uniref:5-deoxy-glucuronate isomerase n=1 Tax=Ignisphaera cupida TaxID=3050454 RepID=A0ABD4Z7Y4_9CREN|nr:5-deoxy-glucuronate isomerase [Ignisphaera sp. 4213-co]MDK6029461.1 5-deoxy-glucuronate isomerase [Ignisphaera sp. 4213-co]